MNIDLQTNEWVKLNDLIDGKTYYIQSKFVAQKNGVCKFYNQNILLSQSIEEPAESDDGFLRIVLKLKNKQVLIYGLKQ